MRISDWSSDVCSSDLAAYVPAVEAGGLLHISGQLPFDDGQLMTGRLGEDRDLAYGVKAAERCALMLIAQVKLALGNLERVERIVKRSEEHTSELQSLMRISYAVFCLKKKKETRRWMHETC